MVDCSSVHMDLVCAERELHCLARFGHWIDVKGKRGFGSLWVTELRCIWI